MYRFKFADIGEGLHEGVVAEIYKTQGDMVEEGDSLFSVETDKVTSDIPSPATGKIVKILMAEGDTIHVGDDIYHIDDGSTSTEAPKVEIEAVKEPQKETIIPEQEEKYVAPQTPATVPVVKQSINSNLTPRMIHINKLLGKTSTVSETPVAQTSINKEGTNSSNVSISCSPLARAIAKDNNVDLSQVKGTGTHNRIMKLDIFNYIANKGTSTNANSAVASVNSSGETRVKVTNLRKTIAKVMKNSWNQVAYTNLFTDIDMTKLWDFRSAVKDKIFKSAGIKITFLAFIVKALSIAIQNYSNMNATYDDKTSELVMKSSFNTGIAVDTKAGLVVPVIHNVQELSVLQIAKEIIHLGGLARDGKLTKQNMSGGTFSITNYGSFGALGGVPVINYPELALAGIGGIVDKVSIINGQISPRKSMLLTVAADHRWIDGGDIAKFARDVKILLEEPAMLWIESEIKNV